MSGEELRLGIIGMSDGNGHPYSWSAIFNGYDRNEMERCPFPAIPAYLAEHSFPAEAIPAARVTHVYTQARDASEHISRASLVDTVVERPEAMIGEIDALLLARDDAEHHLRFARPFLEAGLPVYLDKPIALSARQLANLHACQKYEGQIFTCSALRYAEELTLTEKERGEIGALRFVEAMTPKSWARYAVHLVDPVLAQFGMQGEIVWSRAVHHKDMTVLSLQWERDVIASFSALGGQGAVPIAFTFVGDKGSVRKQFCDSFACFKKALEAFVAGVRQGHSVHDPDIDRAVVAVLEAGMNGTSS